MKVLQEQQEHKDYKVLQVLQDLKVLQDQQEHKGLKELPVLQEQ